MTRIIRYMEKEALNPCYFKHTFFRSEIRYWYTKGSYRSDIYINSSNRNYNVQMYRRKEGKKKVKIGAHKGLILTLPFLA